VIRSLAVTCAVLTAGLAALAAAPAEPGGEPGAEATRTFRFTYTVTVRDIPAGARRLSIWVPVPETDPHQQVLDLVVRSPLEYSFTREHRYGNRLLHLAANAPLPDSIDLTLEAVVARQAYRVLGAKTRPAENDRPASRDLGPDALVPIDGQIAAEARKATKGARTQLDKARAIYDYVTSTMHYDKSGQGWGRGDALRACDVRSGNCTDFHSLVIGMARSCKIPARFVIGFPLPENEKQGAIPGYHCWAEMYVEGIGWLPVDSSEASKHPEKRSAFFGGLDANRVEFTRGRDLELEPPASERLNFLVYPRVEVDGVVYTGVVQSFSFAEVGT
jgi:transglutaminase-like putative cysteine protease